jgi:microcystin-dependent protein
MPSTPTFAIPYPAGTAVADIPADVEALAERLEVLLGRAGEAVSVAGAASGRLLIVQDTGVVAYKAMSGQGTITKDGVLSIPDGALDGSELADNAVGARALDANSVGASELQDNSVDQAAMQDDSIGSPELKANSVGSSELADNSVDQAAMQDNSVGTAELRDGEVTIAKLATALQTALMPVGTVLPTVQSAAPSTDWLLCDGASYLRTDHTALFAALGGASSPYGLPDGTHFNVPDLRGRVPVGADGAGGRLTASDALGNTGGEEKHPLTTTENATHSHGILNTVVNGAGVGNFVGGGGLGVTTGGTINSGNGTPHNNMQPYQIVNYLIRR